jgi:hypothetical protein
MAAVTDPKDSDPISTVGRSVGRSPGHTIDFDPIRKALPPSALSLIGGGEEEDEEGREALEADEDEDEADETAEEEEEEEAPRR